MSPRVIELILRTFFFIVSAIYLYVVFMGIDILKPFLISLPVIFLGTLYVLKVKKKDILVVIAFVLTILGSVFSTFKEFYLLAVVLFFIEHLLFIKLIISYIKPKERGLVPLYILLFLAFFILLFLMIYGEAERDIGYIVVLVYGFTAFSLGALAFANFLYKMNKANFLLLLGFFMSIASDSVYAIDLLDEKKSYYLFLAELLYWFSYYVIYTGFTDKNKKAIKQ
ncbi:lysoplasmalogenase family protein [Tenacibaculum sp. HL-MS23]|uniref:lysoplasmalogenase family protein n=1 Tax=Tenacibaculum sp. HL-MS23 TaxID=3077734 RepID=UPI0028FC321B|nr:lysoplasmalogenase family protein [Tenacibaculum sp. HL-MS23]WNW02085.1 lysoplasmalogenase family protein [Tenacibaculum sp. HL-MS23]